MISSPIFISLLYNAALLLAMVLIFDIATNRLRIEHSRFIQLATGAVLGLACLGVMMTPLHFEQGVLFDTRSVILALGGLFFGALPTAVAVLITAAYRYSLGGGGALTGITVIIASGLIGVLWRHLRSGELEDIRARELYALGLFVHALMIALMLTLPDGTGPAAIVVIGLPILLIHPLATVALGALLAIRLSRHRSERRLEKSEALYRYLVDNLPQNIYCCDRDGRITFANKVFLDLLDTTEERLVGTIAYDLTSPELAQHYRSIDADVLATGETVSMTIAHHVPDGKVLHVEIVKAPIRAQDGSIEGLQCAFVDVTERKQTEARVHRLAYYDTLTGLPNRSLLMDRLSQSLSSDQRADRIEALMLLNIDRFKVINDARGYHLGDALLGALAKRLQDLLHAGDTLARMAGDEFAILLSINSDRRENAGRQALGIAEKIHAGLARPFDIDGEEFMLTVSVGVTLFPENDGDTPEAILRRADTALHRAKASGADQTAFFDIVMGESATQSFRIERELRQAIGNGELRLFLQSQVRPGSGTIGAEALVRWQHPERGLLSPIHFIPVAEESSLITQLGAWVLHEACCLTAAEARAGRPLRISVNISPRHFRQRDFVPWLQALLADSGANPQHLTLEITEGLVISNVDDVASKMDELAAMGVRFSIDDFGTGYSSLAYLKRLPIHELKIDQSFIQDAPNDPNDAALIDTILSIAQHLQLEVVAEGIETAEQAEFLSQRASIVHQGYFYDRPQAAADWLHARSSAP